MKYRIVKEAATYHAEYQDEQGDWLFVTGSVSLTADEVESFLKKPTETKTVIKELEI